MSIKFEFFIGKEKYAEFISIIKVWEMRMEGDGVLNLKKKPTL